MMPTPSRGSRSAEDLRAARWTFWLCAAALLAIMVFASFDFGVTWDEKSRHRYGEDLVEYFRGDRTRASFDNNNAAYGGMFDLICAAAELYVPIERYTLRHIINAIFGWLGVLYTGRLAARWFGTWTGLLAMVLLAVSPLYFAHAMNNPKDIPFAALGMVAIYYLSTISPRWPYISWPTGAKIAVAVAMALNIRAGALLYLGYFGLLVGAYVLADALRARKLAAGRLADTAVRVAAVVVVSMVLGTAFWPWAQGAPLTRPIQALVGLSNFDWQGGVLFNGRNVLSTELPWDYAPRWFIVTTAPVVLVGAALSLVAARRQGWGTRVATMWTIALLPVFLVIIRHSVLYDGIRHLLFVFPPLVVAAAAGWAACLKERSRWWIRPTTAVLLAAGLVNVLNFDIRAHPNQTVYYNELVGGPRGAQAKWELDYWGNCVLQTVQWASTTARLSGRPISLSGNAWQIVQLDSARFTSVYFKPRDFDLEIRLNRGSSEGVAELAAREDALYRVQTPDGAVLCVVLPGPSYASLAPYVSFPPQTAPKGPKKTQ